MEESATLELEETLAELCDKTPTVNPSTVLPYIDTHIKPEQYITPTGE